MYRKTPQSLSEACSTGYSLQTSLRQDKRKQMLNSKRKIEESSDKIISEEKFYNINDQKIHLLCNAIQSENYEVVIQSIQMLKEIVKKAPQISNEFEVRLFDIVLNSMVVPRLLQLFQQNIDVNIKNNILYIFVNISAGKSEHLVKLIKFNTIEQLLPFISISDFQKDICWVFANIASENIKLRNEVMERVVPILLALIQNNKESALFLECVRLVSNFCLFTPKPPVNLFIPFTDYLITATNCNDSKIIAQAILGFDYLCEDQNYCSLLKQSLLPLFVRSIKSSNEDVILVVLQCISTIVGNEGSFAQELIDCGFLNELTQMIDYVNEKITIVLMYCLSNIVACKTTNAAITIAKSKIMKSILIEINTSPRTDMVIESSWVLLNIILVLDDDLVIKVINDSVFDAFYRILTISYGGSSELLKGTLVAIKKIIEIGEKEKKLNGFNCYKDMLDESNCLGLLDGLKDEDVVEIEHKDLICSIEQYWNEDDKEMEFD